MEGFRSSRSSGAWALIPGLLLGFLLLAWAAEREARRKAEEALAGRAEALERAREEAAESLRALEECEARFLNLKLRGEEGRELLSRIEARLQARKEREREKAERRRDPLRLARAEELTRTFERAFSRAGIPGLRVFRVEEAEKGGLWRGVELTLGDREGRVAGLLAAGECRAVLFRNRAVLRLEFHGGKRVTRGGTEVLPEGYRREVEVPEPRLLEKELGDLCAYRERFPEPGTKKPRLLDPGAKNAWAERLEAFLARGLPDQDLRVHSLGGVEGKAFFSLDLNGYDRRGVWIRRIHAGRAEVWFDKSTGVVEFRLFEGFLVDLGGRVGFGSQGYRLPLPGIPGEEAEEILTGFVRRYRSLPGSRGR